MACSKPQCSSYVEEMLTCPVCLELVTEPQTLTQCLHNYCAKCVQQLMDRQQNEPPGVLCPVCRSFSEEKDIRKNHFVNDLLSQHKANLAGDSETRPKQCDQCPGEDTVAAWKCLDCRFHLCQTCKTAHLKIPLLKGHHIIVLSEESESVIDQLLFCSAHHDKPIEFYCNNCEEAICNTCQVVNHNGHTIVTVQNALDSMVPGIDLDLNSLDESLNTIDQGVEQYDVELEKVERTFDQCSDAVDKEVEDRIGRLRKEQDMMKAELDKEKQIQKSLIEDNKNQLINKKKEIANLRNVTRTSLERARHASLLSELVNGGLCRRLKEVTEERINPQSLCTKTPTLKLNTRQWTALEDDGLLGEIVYTTDTLVVGVKVTSVINTGESTYWPGNSKKPMEQTLQIGLRNHCLRFTVCDEKLWAPIYHNNVVQIYTLDGKMVKSVKVESYPTCVQETSTGEMVVSFADSGLSLLSGDSDKAVKIARGSFCDVCVCGDSVYAWDWQKKQIVRFDGDKDWRQMSVITVDCVKKADSWDTLLVRQCGEDRAQLEFFVCEYTRHTVYQVNGQGDTVRQFGSESETGDGALRYPRLCGVGSHRDILVADAGHHQYKLLDTVSGSWRAVYTADSEVYNAVVEGENTVWLSRFTGGKHVITKHEVRES